MSEVSTISFECGNCQSRLNAKPSKAGQSLPCPKCKSIVVVPSPTNATEHTSATEKQKTFAKELGVVFDDTIDKATLSKLIDAALVKQDDNRYARMNELQKVESEARDELRAEVLAEIDEEDPRLSVASIEKILEALQLKDIGAILITFEYGVLSGVDDLTGEKFELKSTDDIDETDMATIVSGLGIAMMRRRASQ